MKDFSIRVLKRKRTLFLILFTFIINFLHFNKNIYNNIYLSYVPLLSIWNQNMVYLGTFDRAGLIYSFLIYVLAAIPLSDSIQEDRETGLINQMLIKRTKKDYIKTTYIANFIYGGIYAIFPLVVHFLIAFIIYPILPVNQININFQNNFLFASLILNNPIVFYLIRLIIVFMVGGGIASFALFINTVKNNKYIGLFGVFIIEWIIQLGFYYFNLITKKMIGIHVMSDIAISLAFKHYATTIIYTLIFYTIPILYFICLARKDS